MIAIDRKPNLRIVAVVTQTKRIEVTVSKETPSESIRDMIQDKFGCGEDLVNETIDVLTIDDAS